MEGPEKYINPYTDFGFKKLFGEEANKDLLIDFLNQLLPEQHQIASLTFKNGEALPDLPFQRKAFFDIHCVALSGEHFIVEMQKAKVNYFKDRALFYATFPVREQAVKGIEWNFDLKPIYFIAILDFFYDEIEELAKFRRDISLKDQDGEEFFDKLHFKFLQMPAFTKQEHELVTRFDKWCYFLKHLSSFDHIPQILNEPLFQKAFHTAELAALTAQQHDDYLKSIMHYIEEREVGITAEMDGRVKERREAVIGLDRVGVPHDKIADGFNISIEKVEEIIHKYKPRHG